MLKRILDLVKQQKTLVGYLVFLAIVVVLSSLFVVSPSEVTTKLFAGLDERDLQSFSKYERGKILSISDAASETQSPQVVNQNVEVRLSGKDESVKVSYQYLSSNAKTQELQTGQPVVLGFIENQPGATGEYVIIDRYRLPAVYAILAGFILLVLALARWRGLTSLVGLGFTVGVIFFGVVPQILLGHNPQVVAAIGAAAIIVVAMPLTHGFKKHTYIAMGSTAVTLGVTYLLAWLMVGGAHLLGIGSEEAVYVQSGILASIDLKGLLLAGIILGALGVLDDVTTTQSSAIEELASANSGYDFHELYRRGLRIGREHIAALVNTLLLAYTGIALPLLLLIVAGSSQPLWVLFNSEPMVEELVRTLVGSTALVLAVPIASLVAAYWFSKKSVPTVVVEETVVVLDEE